MMFIDGNRTQRELVTVSTEIGLIAAQSFFEEGSLESHVKLAHSIRARYKENGVPLPEAVYVDDCCG